VLLCTYTCKKALLHKLVVMFRTLCLHDHDSIIIIMKKFDDCITDRDISGRLESWREYISDQRMNC
jgi:hypothetical protein